MQREKQIRSGPLLEVSFYPVTAAGARLPTRAPKEKRSTAQQQKYNRAQATRKLIRLVNANFGQEDYFLHLTYYAEQAPKSEEEARRDITNYLRRVKTRRKAEEKQVREELAAGCPERTAARLREQLKKLTAPLKYIYVIEAQTYRSGPNKGLANYHFHLFISGGLSERDMEGLWKKGQRVNCDRYMPERFGPEAAARYMSKAPIGSKRFCCSLNLDKPKERVKDGKVSPRAVERMATQRVDDAAYWERRYPGYRFVRCRAMYNEYNQNWYVSAVMYKGESPPWGGDTDLEELWE